jgi:hypothetical protein
MSNLKRLKSLLLINSKVDTNEAGGYKAICFTNRGEDIITTMFSDKAPISTEKHHTSPFFSNKQDKLEYLCGKNKSLTMMVQLLQLE